MDGDESILPQKDLEQCLRSLESRPQWWTSYSNNRQNAMIICQASRIETEKEEMLGLHLSLAKSTAKLDEGLQEALRQAAETSAQHQAFLQTVQALQERLSNELEERGSLLRGLFGKFLNDIEAGFDTVAAAVTSTVGKMQMETSLLSQVRFTQLLKFPRQVPLTCTNCKTEYTKHLFGSRCPAAGLAGHS
jgi:hypothetical protein